MEHLQRVWHASRERLPFRTPGSVPFYEDVYTILNRIQLTIWTIYPFRVMNPHQCMILSQTKWFQKLKVMTQMCQTR